MANNNSTINDEIIEIDLQELLYFMLRKLWILAIFAILGGAVAFGYTKFMVTPMYQTNTSIYVLNKRDDATVTSSDLSLSSQLTKDYAKLITSRRVLDGVIETLELNTTSGSLGGRISVAEISNTRILQITVRDADPAMAQAIADEVRVKASEVIKDVMDTEAVNVVDTAYLPTSPVSPNLQKNVILGAAAGFVVVAAFFVIQFLMDDTIKNEDDVTRYLNLSTLASIPVFGEEESKKKSNSKGKSTSTSATKKPARSKDDDDDDEEEDN